MTPTLVLVLFPDRSNKSLDVFRVDEPNGGPSDDSSLVGGEEELLGYRDGDGSVCFGDWQRNLSREKRDVSLGQYFGGGKKERDEL